MRELPACFTDDLMNARGHPADQWLEVERAADLSCLEQIRCRGGPRSAHEQVEGERRRQNVILVELGCARDALAKTMRSERGAVEPREQNVAGVRLTEAYD